MTWQSKHSQIDASVNFSRPLGSSIIECRFVQREPSQIIAYLSSHAGCLQACRFCHLTATGQTDETPVDIPTYVEQLEAVLDYWQTIRTGQEQTLNINWMARGEPLNNSAIVDNWDSLIKELSKSVEKYSLTIKPNISTIMPVANSKRLVDSFSGPIKPNIYYSLYSLDAKFRKRWIPKGKDPKLAIKELKEFQDIGGKTVVHQAFIKGQNDDPSQVIQLLDFVRANLGDIPINTVRYNSFSPSHGEESLSLAEIQLLMETDFTKTQLVPRVGPDVAASCGTFLN